jgi:hypothetical protein
VDGGYITYALLDEFMCVGQVDKSSLYETLFHCNILSKHHHHSMEVFVLPDVARTYYRSSQFTNRWKLSTVRYSMTPPPSSSYHLHQRFMFINTFKKVNSVHNVIKYLVSMIIGPSDAVLISATIGAVVGAVVVILIIMCFICCLKSKPVKDQEILVRIS